MKWVGRDRRQRIEESRRRTQETERALEQIEKQWPDVRRLKRSANHHVEVNHITELFLAIPREK